MKYQTALNVVRYVCVQLGLPVPTAVFTAADDLTAQQMLGLLNSAGKRLCKPTSGMRWSVLNKTWTLVTVPGQTLYDLPADWDSFIDLTGWNSTSRLPMLGPATDPQWACMKARALGPSTISVVYRTRGNKFELYNSPSSAQTLLIDYTSRSWVQDAVDPTKYYDYVSSDGDTILFDSELIIAKVKLAWLTTKGFDTTAAQSDYNEIEESALCADSDAPVLQLARSDTYPLISTQFNIPDSGYGI